MGPSSPASAFDAIAEGYDETFSNSAVGRSQRRAVWQVLDNAFSAGSRVLELNCGTGLDALHLSQRGVRVVACDVSTGMLAVARRRIENARPPVSVDLRHLANEELAALMPEAPFDGAFSNFAGLNCVADPRAVAEGLAPLIKSGGRLVVCVFGRLCLWEIFWYLPHARVDKAFRRFHRVKAKGSVGPTATFTVQYWPVSQLRRLFAPHFRLESWIGVGVTVPPTCVSPLAERVPWLLNLASRLDEKLCRLPGTRAFADHMVLTFRRV